MDSDDESKLEDEKKGTEKNPGWHYPQRPAICMKLYVMEEYRQEVLMWHDAHPVNWNGPPSPGQTRGLTTIPDTRAIWRVRRLFHSYEGYLQGSLDLSGRFETRYASLVTRMSNFVADFKYALAVQAPAQHIETTNAVGSEMVADVHGVVRPHPALDAFQDKWKVHSCPLDTLLELTDTDEFQSLLLKNQPPIFQQLHLMDLPPELIHNVLRWADMSEARLLGATCRAMHAVAIPYMHESRTIVFRRDKLGEPSYSSGEGRNTWLRDKVTEARSKLLSDMDLVTSRPHIAKCIKTMTFRNDWMSEDLETAGLPHGSNQQNEFFEPIWDGFGTLLTSTSNVTTVELSSTVLTRSIIAGLSSISGLRTLELWACPGRTLPPSPVATTLNALRNLTIWIEDNYDMNLDSLPILKFAVNARMISLAGSYMRLLDVEDLNRSDSNPFLSVERLMMEDCSWSTVPWVQSKALEAAARLGGLRLTHFKFHGMYGLEMEDIRSLVHGFASAPLRVLSLDGSSCADQEFFSLLSDAFPDLRSLTLYYRVSERQVFNKPARWPGCTWEYARYLSSFHALEHFGWNFCVEPLLSSTTFDFTSLEEGYAEDREYTPDELYFTDWSCLGRLFAIHCPTLTTLAFLIGATAAALGFSISRDASGNINVESDCFDSAKMASLFELYEWASPDLRGSVDPNPWEIRDSDGG